ncbi:unnamed protein product [Prunus armeniaca]
MPVRRKPKHVVNNLENKGSKGGNFGSRTDGSIFMSQSNNTVAGGLAIEGRLVNGEQRIWNHISVNEQLNNWISGQKNYKGNGAYVFRHQPTNITHLKMMLGEKHTIEEGVFPLASKAHDGTIPSKLVNPALGQMNSPIRDLAYNTFTIVDKS